MEETCLNKTSPFFQNKQLSWISDLKKIFFFVQKANITIYKLLLVCKHIDACNNYKANKKNTWVSANIPEKNKVGRQNFSFSKFVPR